jgi:riboflavin synthase
MFTGLIKAVGTLVSSVPRGGGRELAVDLAGLPEMPVVGASVSISGACQTVTVLAGTVAKFDAVEETIRRTKLGMLSPGAKVNLEPALRAGDPLDGHIVQGHIDAVGKLLEIKPLSGSHIFRFSLPSEIAALVAEKGSVAVDGISLTVVEAGRDFFTVSVIPHSFARTTLPLLKPGDSVNLEADVLARYASRRAQVEQTGGLTEETLRANGFY